MKEKKKTWVIELGASGFTMHDHEGKIRWSETEEQAPWKMANFAFDQGADEVRHDYDLRHGAVKFNEEK